MPKDEADLALFLPQVPKSIPVQILGVASNTLVRDGGVPGVTIRLGPAFGKVEKIGDDTVCVGAACLDSVLAKKAAKLGLGGMEFYAGIPGTIGGALRMNAGCYGTETKDVLVECVALNRRGQRRIISVADMDYSYRHCGVDKDLVFVEALYCGGAENPEIIQARMDKITKGRAQSQPIKEKTGGSTFKNPDPKISNGRGAWQVIDTAGGRGLKIGGAQMSEKHCNFMINTGTASAKDLEMLGERIREMVRASEGIELEWEIRRIGIEVGDD